MSHLSGYDSEVVGFDSVTASRRAETSRGTQVGAGVQDLGAGRATQTALSAERGCGVDPAELGADAQDQLLREYAPPTASVPGLAAFLRRAVPVVLHHLAENDETDAGAGSDAEEEDEEPMKATLLQELPAPDRAGDEPPAGAVLALAWSGAGRSLAVSTGHAHHERWCTHAGLVRVYTAKRAGDDCLVHALDIDENSCVTALEYHPAHPAQAALLAYGTAAGDVLVCSLAETAETLALAPAAAGRVAALRWAEGALAQAYLTMLITRSGKRRGAADRVLVSAGGDGAVHVWRVNVAQKAADCVVSYNVGASGKPGSARPPITCLELARSWPLRPVDERCREDLFVVGASSGALYLCQVEPDECGDPVVRQLESHRSCVAGVSFSSQHAGLFLSASVDSEMRLHDVRQLAPLKVFHVSESVSCATWLGQWGGGDVALLGVPGGAALYAGGRRLLLAGAGAGDHAAHTTALAATRSGRVAAAGDAAGGVRVWALPAAGGVQDRLASTPPH